MCSESELRHGLKRALDLSYDYGYSIRKERAARQHEVTRLGLKADTRISGELKDAVDISFLHVLLLAARLRLRYTDDVVKQYLTAGIFCGRHSPSMSKLDFFGHAFVKS